MKNTVVILNEQLCSMTLGFTRAGFEVIASYIDDNKSSEIYKHNLKEIHIEDNLLNMDMGNIPDADIYVGRLELVDLYSYKSSNKRDMVYFFKELIKMKRPKSFLMEISRASVKNTEVDRVIADLLEYNYKIHYNSYEVGNLIGLPVNERKNYIIGFRGDIGKDFKLVDDSYKWTYSLEDICKDNLVDEWYFNINNNQIVEAVINYTDENTFLCWKNHRYIKVKNISWNYLKVPLVYIDGKVRKITHREVARLKGYPDDFYIDLKNKAWLYKKLMYSSNVYVIYLIAQSLEHVLNDYSIRNQQYNRAIKFEKLVGEYLERKFDKVDRTEELNSFADFMVKKEAKKIYFEIKAYTNKVFNERMLLNVCKNAVRKIDNANDIFIIVVANVVEENIKRKCKKEYNIEVWDISNILYMFNEYPEIKNEVIALLNYALNGIVETKPEYDLFGNSVYDVSKNDVSLKLKNIKAGIEEFNIYENACIEILKDVFGEYLSLWRKQEKSNSELYRFDLCCKIKHGTSHEFFDTIKDFFNSKYIVFEFKNYSEPITQKEIYTTEKYLYKTALRCVAIIISRKGANNNALEAARGCLRENGKLILCLDDNDLIELVTIKNNNEKPTPELLSDMLDDMLIKLGK